MRNRPTQRERKKKGPNKKQQLRAQGLKRCRDCNEIKALEEFHLTSNADVGTRKPNCKDCANEYWSTRRKDHLDQIVQKQFGGWVCQVCGYDRCRRAIEFHHLESDKKDFAVAERYTTSPEKLETEIKKCALLCANCHREVHDGLIDLNTTNNRTNPG